MPRVLFFFCCGIRAPFTRECTSAKSTDILLSCIAEVVRIFSLLSQNAVSNASGGSLASSSFVRKLRQQARMKEHPYGQDILGVSDLYRRAASQHSYVRAIIQKSDYTIVIMQTDKQAALSGKLRYIQADSTFGVVAAGSAKEGVAAEAIRSAGKRAFEWDLFNIVYVFSASLYCIGVGVWGGRGGGGCGGGGGRIPRRP